MPKTVKVAGKKTTRTAKGTNFSVSRNCMFTLNNHTPDEVTILQKAQVKRMVYQPEEGEQGTPHLQGYVEFTAPISKTAMKAILGSDRFHLERRLGTVQQAYEYCTKPETRKGDPFTIGDFSKEKDKRKKITALDEVQEMITSGKTMAEIYEWSPAYFAKNRKYICDLFDLHMNQQPRQFRPRVVVVVTGKTGVGKSRYFNEKYCNKGGQYYILTKPSGNNNLWFDNYMAQPNVHIEEFYGWMPLNTLQGLLDGYPTRVETKGGHTYFNPKLIYISSNKTLDEWYKWDTEHSKEIYESVLRRISLQVQVVDQVPYDDFKKHMDSLENKTGTYIITQSGLYTDTEFTSMVTDMNDPTSTDHYVKTKTTKFVKDPKPRINKYKFNTHVYSKIPINVDEDITDTID